MGKAKLRAGALRGMKSSVSNRIMKYIAVVLLLILTASCATTSLWKSTDPGKFVRISMDNITEDELKEKELRYYKDYTYHVYYVEKTGIEKLKDYSLRLIGTPVTVVIDAASVILVVGYVLYRPLSREECRKEESCAESEAEQRRILETTPDPQPDPGYFPK